MLVLTRYAEGLYTDCEGLINKSGSPFLKSSLFEIAANGVDLKKLVIGKPGSAADATNGFIAPATLGTCVDQAHAKGWSAGIMAFEVSSSRRMGSKWMNTHGWWTCIVPRGGRCLDQGRQGQVLQVGDTGSRSYLRCLLCQCDDEQDDL